MLSPWFKAGWLGVVLATGLAAADQPLNRPTPPVPPAPPSAGSPVAEFRRLLALSPSQREAELAAMPAERQKLAEALRSKLGEYGALPAGEREARLRVLDLRWYLAPLMRLAPDQRGPRIAGIPEDLRDLVEERLQQWDALPPSLRAELLENEVIARQFLSLAATPAPERQSTMARLTAEQRQQLQESLARWQKLPEDQRQRLAEHFEHFFELPARERRKTLNTLSELERRQMEASLKRFETLSPQRRAGCIEAFGRFASMSAAERNEFLRNAERWQAMTPAERQTWRSLVHQLPPMPPGFKLLPPLPPKPAKLPPGSGVTLTNVP